MSAAKNEHTRSKNKTHRSSDLAIALNPTPSCERLRSMLSVSLLGHALTHTRKIRTGMIQTNHAPAIEKKKYQICASSSQEFSAPNWKKNTSSETKFPSVIRQPIWKDPMAVCSSTERTAQKNKTVRGEQKTFRPPDDQLRHMSGRSPGPGGATDPGAETSSDSENRSRKTRGGKEKATSAHLAAGARDENKHKTPVSGACAAVRHCAPLGIGCGRFTDTHVPVNLTGYFPRLYFT